LPEWVKRYEKLWGINSKLPKDWIARRDGEMLYFTAEEALTYGVVDKLMEAKPSR
jgi:ATP-dependent protease ClpP protease subunit